MCLCDVMRCDVITERLPLPFTFGRAEHEALTRFLCSNFQFGDTFALSARALLCMEEDGMFLRLKHVPSASSAALSKALGESGAKHKSLLVTRVRIKHSHYTRDHVLPIFAVPQRSPSAQQQQQQQPPQLLVLNSCPALPVYDLIMQLLAQSTVARAPRTTALPDAVSPALSAASAPPPPSPALAALASPVKEAEGGAAQPQPSQPSQPQQQPAAVSEERTRQMDVLKAIHSEVQKAFPGAGLGLALDTYVLPPLFPAPSAITQHRAVLERTKRPVPPPQTPALKREKSVTDQSDGVTDTPKPAAVPAVVSCPPPSISFDDDSRGGSCSDVQAKPAISQENLAMLLSMGVTQNRAERALIAIANRSVDQAFEWLTLHAEDPEIVQDKPWEPPKPAVGLLSSPQKTNETVRFPSPIALAFIRYSNFLV
jgi:hypothetical protein